MFRVPAHPVIQGQQTDASGRGRTATRTEPSAKSDKLQWQPKQRMTVRQGNQLSSQVKKDIIRRITGQKE